MRQKVRAVALVGVLGLMAALFTGPTGAQEPRPRAKTGQSSRGAEPSKAAHAPGIHVPDHFNQLEPALTAEQRERIYEIQTRALRESEAVLTAPQRESLQGHRAKARASRPEPAPAGEPARATAPRKKAG